MLLRQRSKVLSELYVQTQNVNSLVNYSVLPSAYCKKVVTDSVSWEGPPEV